MSGALRSLFLFWGACSAASFAWLAWESRRAVTAEDVRLSAAEAAYRRECRERAR